MKGKASYYVGDIPISFNLNSNDQSSPQNYVLNVQIFIFKYHRIVGHALKKKYISG